MSYLKFNGKTTSEFGLRLEGQINFVSPEKESEFVKIPGRDGEIAFSDGTLKNVDRSFPFRLRTDQSIEVAATNISNWLYQDSEWHELEFGGDPDYIYRAYYHEELSIQRTISSYGKCVLNFTLKPYKFLKSGLDEISFPSVLRNPTNRDARPRITIKGTGNITIRIGSETLTLRAVDEGIIIDTLNQTVTTLDGKRPAWDKVTSYPLPVIKPGRQNVTITGTVTSREIIPRWEVVV